MRKIPELLAPAGGMKQLVAAVENGADAVYLGGPFFNARAKADNFGPGQMEEALDYAHVRGVKIYVTMNTLIRDEEMRRALLACEEVCRLGADALILQDFGLARAVREYLPDMPLHLSTQGTVYNLSGALAARRMGFTRVVAARETGLPQIREICGCRDAPQLEVFVHGALCMCYSGQCHLSREIGGRSGNRGACAQPCRLPYEAVGPEEVEGGRGRGRDMPFPLSPRDLCLVDYLGEIAEAGVASLKIEGRLKSAEYVALVTGIYRKYLDAYGDRGQYHVSSEDRRVLRQIFSRGPFTTGYFLGNPGEDLMSGELPKHQGVKIGTVTGTQPEKKRVEAALTGTLEMGDGVEIRRPKHMKGQARAQVQPQTQSQPQGIPGNVVTFLKEKGRLKGMRLVTLGSLTGDIRQGDEIYKITEKALMERAFRSYGDESFEADKRRRKVGIKALAEIGQKKNVRLTLWDELGNQVIKDLGQPGQKAERRPLTEEEVEEQLKKTGGTPFRLEEIEVRLEPGTALRLSQINGLRREALEELTSLRIAIPFRRVEALEPLVCPAGDDGCKTDPGRTVASRYCCYVYGNTKHLYEGEDPLCSMTVEGRRYEPFRLYLPYEDFLREDLMEAHRNWRRGGIQVTPVLPAITQGPHDLRIRKNFDAIARAAEADGISVGNLGWVSAFVEAGVRVYGDYGLNLQNSQAFLAAREWGLAGAIVGHEWNQDPGEIHFHGLEPEVAVGGRIPVMVTAHLFPEILERRRTGRHSTVPRETAPRETIAAQRSFLLRDRKGAAFPVRVDEAGGQSVVISHKALSAPDLEEALHKNPGVAINQRIYCFMK